MALFWILFIVVIVVAAVIISSKGQPNSPIRKRGNSGVEAYQVANNLRILLESAQIINKTSKYDIKLSRSKLMWDVFKRLNEYNGDHLTKDEKWFQTLQSFERFVIDLDAIDRRRFQALYGLQSSRSDYRCPYCKENTFQEGSRAVKCTGCGKKASRLKISKTETLLVLPEELDKVQSIEKEALDLSPENPTNSITVSPQVGMVIKQMEEKLSRQTR